MKHQTALIEYYTHLEYQLANCDYDVLGYYREVLLDLAGYLVNGKVTAKLLGEIADAARALETDHLFALLTHMTYAHLSIN